MSSRHGHKQKGKKKRKGGTASPAIQKASASADVKNSKPIHSLTEPNEGSKETTVAFSKIIRKPDPFDVALWGLLITFVIAVIYFFQLRSMQESVDLARKAMKIEQRPWIRVTVTPREIRASAPIGAIVHLVDNGKTPAKGVVRGDLVVEKLKNGEEPNLDYPFPHVQFTTGMIVPNDAPQDVPVYRLRTPHETEPLTASELDDFNHSKIYFIVYGSVYYRDFFGTEHWTKFCEFFTPPSPSADASGSGITARHCTNYGDVDDN